MTTIIETYIKYKFELEQKLLNKLRNKLDSLVWYHDLKQNVLKYEDEILKLKEEQIRNVKRMLTRRNGKIDPYKYLKCSKKYSKKVFDISNDCVEKTCELLMSQNPLSNAVVNVAGINMSSNRYDAMKSLECQAEISYTNNNGINVPSKELYNYNKFNIQPVSEYDGNNELKEGFASNDDNKSNPDSVEMKQDIEILDDNVSEPDSVTTFGSVAQDGYQETHEIDFGSVVLCQDYIERNNIIEFKNDNNIIDDIKENDMDSIGLKTDDLLGNDSGECPDYPESYVGLELNNTNNDDDDRKSDMPSPLERNQISDEVSKDIILRITPMFNKLSNEINAMKYHNNNNNNNNDNNNNFYNNNNNNDCYCDHNNNDNNYHYSYNNCNNNDFYDKTVDYYETGIAYGKRESRKKRKKNKHKKLKNLNHN